MKRVFIDCGAHKGQTVNYFLSRHGDAKLFEIHCFEPYSVLWKLFDNLPVILHKQAVWIYTGKIDFYPAKMSAGSTLLKGKKTGKVDYEHPIAVDCVDLDEWIRKNFDKSDYIILKLNVEGAEYEILKKMKKNGSLAYINELFVEFHQDKIEGIERGITREALDLFRDTDVIVKIWDIMIENNLKIA